MARLDNIQAYVKTLEWGNAATEQSNAQTLAAEAIAAGATQQDVAAAMHLPYLDVAEFFSAYGVSRFATGAAFTNGVVSRPTMFDMGEMGEKTPEAIMPLVNIGGSLGVRAIGGGNSNSDSTDAELRQLREENKAQALAIAGLNLRMVKLLERWELEGMPRERATA
ncbi:MAG: hypothetical protein ABI606_16425 [Rhodoferax sp.]